MTMTQIRDAAVFRATRVSTQESRRYMCETRLQPSKHNQNIFGDNLQPASNDVAIEESIDNQLKLLCRRLQNSEVLKEENKILLTGNLLSFDLMNM